MPQARAGVEFRIHLNHIRAVGQLDGDSDAGPRHVVGVLVEKGEGVRHSGHHPAKGSSPIGSTRVTNGRSSPAARAAS